MATVETTELSSEQGNIGKSILLGSLKVSIKLVMRYGEEIVEWQWQ
jgi:hypothetical protein